MTDRNQDDGWIRAVLERHERPLLAYALRLLGGDVEQARDLVQDVFLRLVRADREAIGPRTTAWLFRVCRNRALDLRARTLPTIGLEVVETQAEAASAEPHARLEARDDATHLREAVERLPARERELVRLKFEHGLSYEEMAHVTGITATNVGFLLHKALRSLREHLSVTPRATRSECAS